MKFSPSGIRRPENLKNDLLSGLTVALALVPEAIAFAFIVGIDPTIGLYAAFMMGLVTAAIGGRPGMISGATGAVAVIFAPLVREQVKKGGMESALDYLFAAVVLMGLIQILFGVLKLGKFIRLVPHPVMLGFVNGLAIVIFRSQFEMFFTGHAETFEEKALVLGVMGILIAMTMAIIQFLPKLTKAVPATLVAIITVSLISFILNKAGISVLSVLDFVQEKDPARTTLAASLPTFSLPRIPVSIEALKKIFPYSMLAASVGLIESLMTLTLVDELTDTRGRGNKECIGQGVANMVNGLFGGMGGCAMIGQSVINIKAGGRSRLSGITAAVALLGFILFGAPLIENIPLAALVGVMFMVVIGTFEWSSFRVMKQIPKSDALVIVLVSVVTVTVDLAIAVAAGIIFSALVFAWEKGKKIDFTETTDENGTKVYKLNGALFFASVHSFKDIFRFAEDPEHIVIDFMHTRVHDHSGVEALNFVTEKYSSLGKKLHILNLSHECRILLKKADGIVEVSEIEGLEWHHLADDSLA
ncbi:SulP family inorganic anion transporter [Spirochaeta isovalerica]|uniref:SulP family sulfate permease n=1 Tax=Spirochaeta isovalerica TaxID=150 RepID=A0A841RGC1_9SPIO|nr:SulP family inorganic anion transporter [Spirochaeta isovalerica]MBB6482267.1 SulP family sulfate permease [Spirochaeta isovalerica]